MSDWTQDDVVLFFEDNGFPTDAIYSASVNGISLIYLYEDEDAYSMFTDPLPSGFGLSNEMFHGKLVDAMSSICQQNTF